MKEAREKAEREKAERANRKQAFIDITDQTQEGVLDSILQAMQTGSAFSRKQRCKKPAPAGSSGGKLYLHFRNHTSVSNNSRVCYFTERRTPRYSNKSHIGFSSRELTK